MLLGPVQKTINAVKRSKVKVFIVQVKLNSLSACDLVRLAHQRLLLYCLWERVVLTETALNNAL